MTIINDTKTKEDGAKTKAEKSTGATTSGPGLRRKDNQVWFCDEITPESMFNLRREIETAAEETIHACLASKAPFGSIPLEIHFTSNGGDVVSALAMYDYLRELDSTRLPKVHRVPVHFYGEGMVASAGTIVYLAGRKRFVTPNTTVMIHQLSTGVVGYLDRVEDNVAFARELMEKMTDIYLDRTKLPVEDVEAMLKRNTFFNAIEAKKVGFATDITRI